MVSKPIQDRVRAVIIQNGKVVLIKRVRPDRTYWVFPGGGVEEKETHAQALKRECKEELGVEIEPGELISRIETEEPDVVQSSYFYLCTIADGELGTGTGPEFQGNGGYVGTHNVDLMSIKDMRKCDVLPREVREEVYKKFS